MSAGERKQRIIADIIHDFMVQPRLNNDRGTAILGCERSGRGWRRRS